jgi:hypothetical protein
MLNRITEPPEQKKIKNDKLEVRNEKIWSA